MNNVPRNCFAGQYADRMAGMAPCKDCPDRYPGCGSACDKYKGWKDARLAHIQEYHRRVAEESEVEAVHRHGMDKCIRRHGRKVGTQGR